jgi:hypothetical protein
MKILFLFVDGIGLGKNDPLTNPFLRAKTPFLDQLLENRKLISEQSPFSGPYASLLSLDACLGVPGMPQSATGQATLLTGMNIPAQIGYHYGPKPNPEISVLLTNGNIFSKLSLAGKRCAFLNAYPPAYFKNILSGRRMNAAIPMAAASAGLDLRTVQDLRDGNAISADITGSGWKANLDIDHIPLYSPKEAGRRMAHLALAYDFSLFEYWLSDYAGHHQNMDVAIELLESLDQALEGIYQVWDSTSGLILMTSDHGNMEDLSTRRHTLNPVPALLIGDIEVRRVFQKNLKDISGITPGIMRTLTKPHRDD